MKAPAKPGIYAWFGFMTPMRERMRLIAEAGFGSVMLWWGEEMGEERHMQPPVVRDAGLEIANMHMPFDRANDIWLDSEAGDAQCERYLRCVEDCGRFEIPAAVAHITAGNEPPARSEAGLARIARIAALAESVGVDVALENLRRLDYLDYIYDNVKSPRLKFCYDSGHENCFTPGADALGKYGSRLATMHLHDNRGVLDQHMIPFAGTVDWRRVTRLLARYAPTKPLTFECAASHDFTRTHTAREYLDDVAQRARRLAEMVAAA